MPLENIQRKRGIMVIIGNTAVEVLVYDCYINMYGVPVPFRNKLMYDTPKTYSELLMLCRDIVMYEYSYIVTIRCWDIEPFEDETYNGVQIDMTQGAYDYPYVSVKRVIIRGCWANAHMIDGYLTA